MSVLVCPSQTCLREQEATAPVVYLMQVASRKSLGTKQCWLPERDLSWRSSRPWKCSSFYCRYPGQRLVEGNQRTSSLFSGLTVPFSLSDSTRDGSHCNPNSSIGNLIPTLIPTLSMVNRVSVMLFENTRNSSFLGMADVLKTGMKIQRGMCERRCGGPGVKVNGENYEHNVKKLPGMRT